MTTMSRREKTLAALVGGIVLIFLNLFLISFFLQNQARLRAELVRREGELKALQTVIADRPALEQRAGWLQGTQPRLQGDETREGFELLKRIQQAAQTHVVKLENPLPGRAERRPQYVSLPVTIETRSEWKPLVHFMHELQGPDQFIVFESANLQVDKQDTTQMHGRFKIARWYAQK